MFSNTLGGDYNSSPSDTLATRGPRVIDSDRQVNRYDTASGSALAGGPAVHELIIKTDRIPTLIFTQRMDVPTLIV